MHILLKRNERSDRRSGDRDDGRDGEGDDETDDDDEKDGGDGGRGEDDVEDDVLPSKEVALAQPGTNGNLRTPSGNQRKSSQKTIGFSGSLKRKSRS